MHLKQPFFAASFAEFCDRLSYYGLQSLLVLFLTHVFGLSINASYSIYGSYTALTFASCIIGGIIADKLLTQYQAVFLGSLLAIIGNILLIFVTAIHPIYFAISLLILAVGLTKPSTACLIGLLEERNPEEKSKAFLYFYLIGSIGSILGPIFYGIGIAYKKYWIGFIFAITVLLINFSLLVFSAKALREGVCKKLCFIRALSLIVLIIAAIYLILSNIILIEWLIIPALVVSVVFLWKMLQATLPSQKFSLCRLSIPLLASIVFFTMLLQIFSSVTIFIEKGLNTHAFGWQIPITWFSSIEAIFLLLITPLFGFLWEFLSKRKIEVSREGKVIVGMIATSATFFFLFLAAKLASTSNYTALCAVILANFSLAVGELCIIPISIALITTHSPARYKGMLMGIFYFLLSFSGYLSGILAKASPENIVAGSTSFATFFLYLGIGVLGFTGLLLLLDLCLKQAYRVKAY